MQLLRLTALVLIVWTKVSFSARILCIAPLPTFSHSLFFQPIWRALADRGHQLTVMSADLMQEPHPNIRQIDLGFAYDRKKMVYSSASTPTRYNWPLVLHRYMKMFTEVATVELESAEVQKLLTNQTEHFDLVIAEMHITVMFAFAHRFECPLVGISSFDILNYQHEVLGNPTHSSQYPELCGNMAPRQMSFEERAIELFNYLGSYITLSIHKREWDAVRRKYFGPNVPTDEELTRSIYFVLLNVAPFINSRPLGPKMVPIGGARRSSQPEPLGRELQELLDQHPQGVLYFSMGTNVKDSQIPRHILNTTLEALGELPYQVIWKWKEGFANLPKNVRIFSWLPQKDLLRHPNVKAFIFQGGLHSKEEAIHAMVPMVGIPMMGEQRKNVDDNVARGLGVLVDKDTLTKEGLKETIRQVIEVPSFKRNLKTFAHLLHDSAQSGVEKAVWHVEFALRNPQGAPLLGHTVPLPWYQYNFLDIILGILVVFGAVVALAWWVVLVLTRRLFRCKVKCE